MAKLADILTIEAQRPKIADWHMIHLFKDGKFLRAYEQSAWLLLKATQSGMKVTHRKSPQAESGSFLFVGFPLDSLQKYTPTGTNVSSPSDGEYLIALNPESFPQETTPDILLDDYIRWKKEQPVSEKPVGNAKGEPSATTSTSSSLSCETTIQHLIREMLSASDDIASATVTISVTRK